MPYQDFGVEVSTNQDLTGASPDNLPWVVSTKAYTIGTVQNLLVDVGQGGQLAMEFEVTEAFTGYSAANAIPHLMMGTVLSDSPTLATNRRIYGMCGWNLHTTQVEFGLQASDSLVLPALRLGDKYYSPIPPGVFGLPWTGTSPTLSEDNVPGSFYIGAFYALPMRTSQPVPLINTGLWTLTDFTAGKISARLTNLQPQAEGHHYATKMNVV